MYYRVAKFYILTIRCVHCQKQKNKYKTKTNVFCFNSNCTMLFLLIHKRISQQQLKYFTDEKCIFYQSTILVDSPRN